ncbi:MAG: FAD-dependent oxidoreductase [Chloroflexota bacterium]
MKLAIIGAGAAGLAAARKLHQRQPNLSITIYEKSRGLGGRAATRRRDGFVFDRGAQYFKSPSPAVEQLLTKELATDSLHDIGHPVWTFDQHNTITEGDRAQNAEPKWVYRDGLNRLGKLLANDLDVQREVRIGRLQQVSTDNHKGIGYELYDVAGQFRGLTDMVLLTPPAPQIVDILNASEIDSTIKETLQTELVKATYRRCLSLALAYDHVIERPFYALVNTDRAHPISWLGLEHKKGPERCPAGHSLLLPQMAAQFSLDHWETPPESLIPLVAEQVSELLGTDLRTPLWGDVQRWRYALPDSSADFATLNQTNSGLFFAGDYTTGQGRVHLAIENGWRVAEELERYLNGTS